MTRRNDPRSVQPPEQPQSVGERRPASDEQRRHPRRSFGRATLYACRDRFIKGAAKDISKAGWSSRPPMESPWATTSTWRFRPFIGTGTYPCAVKLYGPTPMDCQSDLNASSKTSGRFMLKELIEISLRCLLATAILLGLAGGVAPAGETGPPENDLRPLPIEITADRLVNHGRQNYAEFIGNVEAAQGNFSIRSDTLKITYRRSDGAGTKGVSDAESIDKIEAIGGVKIKSDDRRAETDRAEYRLQEDVIELIGDNSFVTDGKNTLTGSKITWHRQTGQITVAGSDQKRVKAVFYSTKTLAPQAQDPADGSEKAPPK